MVPGCNFVEALYCDDKRPSRSRACELKIFDRLLVEPDDASPSATVTCGNDGTITENAANATKSLRIYTDPVTKSNCAKYSRIIDIRHPLRKFAPTIECGCKSPINQIPTI